MSQVYTLEPPTKGKVVLRTSMGDIDIELWPKEAPRAVRNFVQLCLEGYYDGTAFHRLLKDFIVQGGERQPGADDGGATIYGRPFGDEFHSRLKFNHRGLIACVNQDAPDTNGPQFFITLDRADHLDKKATIFGKVTGDTVYNLMRLNELEVDEGDRPVHPPVVTRADVLWNPFEDIRPRVDRDAKAASAAEEAAAREAAAKKARRGAKNFSLISFGEEAEEEEEAEEQAAAALKIKSAHDLLEDDKLSKEAAVEIDLEKVRAAMRAAKAGQEAPAPSGRGGGLDLTERMKERVESKRAKASATAAAAQQLPQPTPAAAPPASDEDEEDDDEGAEAPRGPGGERKRARERELGAKSVAAVVAPSRQLRVHDGELLSAWERKREEYKERKRLGGHREKDTMSKLASFMGKLKSTPAEEAAKLAGAGPAIGGSGGMDARDGAAGGSAAAPAAGNEKGYDGKVDDSIDHRAFLPAAWRLDTYLADEAGEAGGVEDEGLDSLRGHKFVFQGGKDAMRRTEAVDDYVVLDPLLEAGKAKFNKQQQKAKKRRTDWAGGARD